MKTLYLAFIFLIALTIGCSQSTQPENPKWIDGLIKEFQTEEMGSPPQSIWRYEYHGQTVYYVPPQCCDQFSTLYDANGTVLCAPDGGFTGGGDFRCQDFFVDRKNEKLVWKDSRGP